MYTEIVTIQSVKREKSSVNGNPAFTVTFTDGRTARTSPNTMAAMVIENQEYRNVPVQIMFTPRGRIVGIKVV